ncbi:galactoside 2-alpha-L-fucosyltransferase-like isoform X1 [Tripterygium wilfordii]|uniref:Fucosyltransferase n=1 Tax=Tripterygium wilfordii TaxID=458696 RepID=A0A7J7D8T9_TRIWF|nr:galactoside 2-alpha-L-fucosyltransferase-like [Tripterygium wilfordii]KAF5742476.1 galactoside 2-alpha-L-fucosyltransferase-like isoform X1 [Tripterygium wilfordii]
MKSHSFRKTKSKIFLIALLILVTFSAMIYRNPAFNPIEGFVKSSCIGRAPQSVKPLAAEKDSSEATTIPNDKLFGGLLAPGFDKESCVSRYQSGLYRKASPHKPSSYLISKLRNYENLHKRCGPYTESYNKSLVELQAGYKKSSSTSTECKYLVWLPHSGLGNRILSMASAFLYALLTNRVLLVEHELDMADIFCDPFPNTSWLLPIDFPLKNDFNGFNMRYPEKFGNIVRRNDVNVSPESPVPAFIYVHLEHDYNYHDMLFFCDQNQAFLDRVPWLITLSDNYFIPALFMMPSFEQELNKLFPDKEKVFHFLGRYLFHPSNQVWGKITRFYNAFLAKADEKIGIQVRVFDAKTSPFQSIKDQILGCALREKLLPDTDKQNATPSKLENQTSKAVLITSLYPEYYESLRNMYLEESTVTGEVISVYQPSHEVKQVFGNNVHNMKAWAEMYLLSLSDVLITSSWSTFGYVAQGLGALKPWILYKPEDPKTPDLPCFKGVSIEPCFHSPPVYECKAKIKVDTGALVPHVKHCEDRIQGIKLFNS